LRITICYYYLNYNEKCNIVVVVVVEVVVVVSAAAAAAVVVFIQLCGHKTKAQYKT